MFEFKKAGNEMGGVCDECCKALDDAYMEAFEHVG